MLSIHLPVGACLLVWSALSGPAVAQFSTIGGGADNVATGWYATVAGGLGNTASGNGSAIAGGLHNSASGVGSFAAGTRTSAGHDYAGAFGFCDGCNCTSTMSGTLNVCVDHGFFVNGLDVVSVMNTMSVDMAEMQAEMANCSAMGQSMATMESALLGMSLQMDAMNASMTAMTSSMQQMDMDTAAMNASMAMMQQTQQAMQQMAGDMQVMRVAMDQTNSDMNAMNATMTGMNDDMAQTTLEMTAMQSDMADMKSDMADMQSDMADMQASMWEMQTASSFVDETQTTAVIAGAVVGGLVLVAIAVTVFFVVRAQKAARFTNEPARAVTGINGD